MLKVLGKYIWVRQRKSYFLIHKPSIPSTIHPVIFFSIPFVVLVVDLSAYTTQNPWLQVTKIQLQLN